MVRNIFAWIFVASCVLTGCMASGVKVSDEQAQSFKVGKSTYADVIGQLGPPTSSSLSSDGSRTANYSYSAASARPQDFIPYIGPLVSGYDTSSSAVTFVFDARGILKNMSSTQNNVGIGSNLAAGGPQLGSQGQPQSAQPRVDQ
jgi:hypothetical protein